MAQAQDSGHPSLSGTVTVYINVIDLNDNAPIFDPMSFSNEILEDVPVGASVVTVSATDMDAGIPILMLFLVIIINITSKSPICYSLYS